MGSSQKYGHPQNMVVGMKLIYVKLVLSRNTHNYTEHVKVAEIKLCMLTPGALSLGPKEQR